MPVCYSPTMAMSGPEDAYAVLGVDPASDDESIAAAYRHLARRYHPDIAGESATLRMMSINAAWDRLRDARRRAEYDEELREIDPVRAAAARRRPRPRAKSRDEETSGLGTSAPVEPVARPATRDGTGAAGRPPGRPSGSVLDFGRFLGWSMGEISRIDPGYLIWLEDHAEGRRYLEEIDRTLRQVGVRGEAEAPKIRKPRFSR